MIIYNELISDKTNLVKINTNLKKHKNIKIKFSLFLKVIFLKYYLEKENIKKYIIYSNNKIITNKSNSNLSETFSFKKNLNSILNERIHPISNFFFFTKNKLKKLVIYYISGVKLKNTFFSNKRHAKKAAKLKKKVIFNLINVILKLKELILIIKNLNNFFNLKTLTKKNLFLLLKQKFPRKLKSKQLIFSVLKNNREYYKLIVLVHFLKEKKNVIKQLSKTSLLYNKLIGLFTKKGEKRKSLKIINNALLQVSKTSQIPINEILIKLYNWTLLLLIS